MHHCRILPEHELVIMTFFGDLKLEDVMRGVHELLGHPLYRPGYVGVCDLRAAEIAADVEETQRVADWVVANTANQAQWAYIVDGPRSTALTEYYAEIVKAKHPTQVFSTVAAASAYLDLALDGILIVDTDE